MEIIDFNPFAVRRRLSAEVEAKTWKGNESGSALASGRGGAVAKDQDNENEPTRTGGLGEGKAVPGNKTEATSDPKHDEQENRRQVVTDPPFQLPDWIPLEAAVDCNLPYTSYEIPIPPDLNMDCCIDVMMGQDSIVFMFVCGAYSILVCSKLILMELQDNEAGDEYTWSILSF